jgi:alkanesulfonate monooxygenase SsuD/methylene tetrahydromethanopterin reductase-like flavin-dependent oxidoreductase (luciferase family)
MPIAVSVASRSGLSAAAVGELARAAERGGVDAFFVAESATDSFVLCQAALAVTDAITVGTAVANARLRHPAAAAMATATLDEWSGGRFRIGLGVSNARFNELTLGMAPIQPLAFMREYVAQMRRTLGDGTPAVPLDRAPQRCGTPIMIAAMQPRMLGLAGEIADGAILSLTTPATLPAAVAAVHEGIARAGRRREDVTIACVMPCCFDGADLSRRAGRSVVTGYARHPAAAQVFGASGFGAQLPLIAAALDRGEAEAAAALVDDRMLGEFVLSGEPDDCAQRVRTYLDAGVDLPILFPMPGDGTWERAIRNAIDVAPALLPAPTSARH